MLNKIINKVKIELSYYTGEYSIPPQYISLILTFRCNFRCKSCSIWKNTDFSKEITDKDWLNIADQLISFLPKSSSIELNGGEPLIKKALVLKLIKKLSSYFDEIALNTNGLLINKEIVQELKKAGLDKIKISFYSLDKREHNYLRGTAGAFDAAKKAVDIVVQSKLGLEVGILITSVNIENIPFLIEYLSQRSAKIILQPLDEVVESSDSKNMKTNFLPKKLWPSKAKVKKLFLWLEKNKDQTNIVNSDSSLKAIMEYYLDPKSALNFRCFAGIRNLVIYPDGKLAFCFKAPAIGNCKGKDVSKILLESKEKRKQLKTCKKYCRILGCNFARGFKEFFKR